MAMAIQPTFLFSAYTRHVGGTRLLAALCTPSVSLELKELAAVNR